MLAEGRPGLAVDCSFSEEADGEEVEDDFSAASFSEAALITGLTEKRHKYSIWRRISNERVLINLRVSVRRGIKKLHSMNICGPLGK